MKKNQAKVAAAEINVFRCAICHHLFTLHNLGRIITGSLRHCFSPYLGRLQGCPVKIPRKVCEWWSYNMIGEADNWHSCPKWHRINNAGVRVVPLPLRETFRLPKRSSWGGSHSRPIWIPPGWTTGKGDQLEWNKLENTHHLQYLKVFQPSSLVKHKGLAWPMMRRGEDMCPANGCLQVRSRGLENGCQRWHFS